MESNLFYMEKEETVRNVSIDGQNIETEEGAV